MESEIYFEDLKGVLESELKKAHQEVKIAVAWINFKEYLPIMQELLDRNVRLNIVCSDNWQNRTHQTYISQLIKDGANIQLLKMPSTRNHMHHKFVVIDGMTVINGSFNWSPNAERSFENLMVLRNIVSQAKKFEEEFERLQKIETKTIKQLQKKNSCPEKDCSGQVFSVLIFSEHRNKYFEVSGDLVKICNYCERYETEISCITNNQLPILVEEINYSTDDYELEYIEKLINNELNSYLNNGTVIHAIGRVKTILDGYGDEEIMTKILWKNRFVGEKLPDVFPDENFDVVYDN